MPRAEALDPGERVATPLAPPPVQPSAPTSTPHANASTTSASSPSPATPHLLWSVQTGDDTSTAATNNAVVSLAGRPGLAF